MRPEEDIAVVVSNAERALLPRLDGIGDLILAAPFMKNLRESYPRLNITALLSAAGQELLGAADWFDDVLIYESSGDRTTKVRRAVDFGLNTLKPLHFDTVIDSRFGADMGQTALLSRLSLAHTRIGFTDPEPLGLTRLHRSRERLYTHLVSVPADLHETTKSYRLLRSIGGSVRDEEFTLELNDAAREKAYELVRGFNGNFITVGIGAGHPKRTWPEMHTLGFLRGVISTDPGLGVVLIGGRADAVLGGRIADELPVLNVCGNTSLQESASIIALARAHLGPDSGPAHIAGAVQTPTIVVSSHSRRGDPSATNSPTRFHPLGEQYVILRPEAPRSKDCSLQCSSEEPHCILDISPNRALAALRAILNDQEQGVAWH